MNILFLGHSLIEYFDWQERFPEHRVANLGVAGESVEGLLARIEEIMRKHPAADLLVLMTGLNDIAMEDYSFFGSYRQIIRQLAAGYPAARICVNAILPVRLEFIANESIQAANRQLKDLAAETGAEFLDAYQLFVDAAGEPIETCYTEDGVHLSDRGYAVWSKALAVVINSHCSGS